MKVRKKRIFAMLTATLLMLTSCSISPSNIKDSVFGGDKSMNLSDVTYMAHPSLWTDFSDFEMDFVTSPISYQTVKSDLSNVYFGMYEDLIGDNDNSKQLLADNGFFLEQSYDDEFFQQYESNRYTLRANYITVDSMMHTYHLYFAHLLKNVEKEYLKDEMLDISKTMMSQAQNHYDKLKGTEWEDAAKLELAYFCVGTLLLDSTVSVPSYVENEVNAELDFIYSTQPEVAYSNIFPNVLEDYSQYIPRGYYDESENLKKYFRSMMWYGRMGFTSNEELTNRATVLINMAMQGETLKKWERVYTVTSFFAGASDDITYYEIKPYVNAIWGKNATVEDLIDDNEKWETFNEVVKDLPAPQINSIPVLEAASDEEHDKAQKGFRFMGQRFSIDEACFTQLVYRQVDENENNEKRLLPDALDFPAALGSDTALSILKEEGKTDYPNYDEQMNKVRSTVNNASKESWHASLYSAWIYTLMPIIETKNEIYPPFMRTEEWQKKSLVSFEGSYTELKHDTILYSKQVMGEMGGVGDEYSADDRGYVEAEPEVFARLQSLVSSTKSGLDAFGMLSDEDKNELDLLAELSGQLKTIAVKELKGELPTDEEFELIRCYGGNIEHFWKYVMDNEFPDEYSHNLDEHSCPVVADIATDPNGFCLEVGTGKPMTIYVIVEVDGVLKVASGSVYSFYQFQQPLSNRLTDSEWQYMLKVNPDENGIWYDGESVELPEWYSNFVYDRNN